MKYGIDRSVIQSIIEVFKKNETLDQAILFGSRAMGNYHSGSDIDIAVMGKNFSFNDYLTILSELSQLDSLYTIDLIRYESIDNPDLREHIKRAGIVLYQKNNIAPSK